MNELIESNEEPVNYGFFTHMYVYIENRSDKGRTQTETSRQPAKEY